MPGINYDKWATLNSDSDDDGGGGNNAAQKANKSSTEARSSKATASAPESSTIAQRRKAEADVVFNTVLGRRLDPTTREGFTEAIRLYEGALAALPATTSTTAAAAATGAGATKELDLKLSCHMNIAAASIQLSAWAQATKHCEGALALAPALPKALEFQAHVLWQGLGRPAAAAEALRKGFAAAEAAGMKDPAKEMPELARTWRKAMEAVARHSKSNSTTTGAKAATQAETGATASSSANGLTATGSAPGAASAPKESAFTVAAEDNTAVATAGPTPPPAPLPLPSVDSPEAALPAETLAAEAANAEAIAQKRIAQQSAAQRANHDAASRKAVTTAVADAAECKARGDWPSAERHLKDAKRLATAAGDAAGRAVVAGLLAQALAAQAVPAPAPTAPSQPSSTAAAAAPPTAAVTVPGIQVSPNGVHRVVADERRLKAAVEELQEGLEATDQALRDIAGMPIDTTAATWSPPSASLSTSDSSPTPTTEALSSSTSHSPQNIEVARRVWLTRARLQRQAAELKGLQVKGPMRERGFAHDRNAARADAVECLRDALRSANIAIDNSGSSIDRSSNSISISISISNSDSDSSNGKSGSSSSDASIAPPGSATVRVGVLMDLGRALLQIAEPEVDSDDERSRRGHGHGKGSSEEEGEGEGGKNVGDERRSASQAAAVAAEETHKKRAAAGRSSRAEAVSFLLQARDALAPGGGGDGGLNQEASTGGTNTLRADLEESLADAYAGLGDAASAIPHATAALTLLSEILALARGIKPTGMPPPPPSIPSQASPATSAVSSDLSKRATQLLANERYGQSTTGKAELRVAAAELNLASLTMLSVRQTNSSWQPGHYHSVAASAAASTTKAASAVKLWKTAAKRMHACGEPLRGAQALQQAAHEAYLNDQDREMAGGLQHDSRTTGGQSGHSRAASGVATNGSSSAKEGESDRQERRASAAECLWLAAEYYTEAKDLVSMASNSNHNGQRRRRQPLSAEPISAKPSRLAAYLTSKEVECLNLCSFLWQCAPHDLAATHQRLHTALSMIARQSQSPAHRKQVADNQHRWAVAVARAARDDRASSKRASTSSISSSSSSRSGGGEAVGSVEGGAIEGLQGADTLLEAAGIAYTSLGLPRDAAGCALARGVLAHRSGQLPDAVAHLARAQALFAEHDYAGGGAAARATTTGAAAPSADGTSANTRSDDDDADRVECGRLLAAWTKELHATAGTAGTAAESSPLDKSKEKEAEAPPADIPGESQMPPAAALGAPNNGLKRRSVGTASSSGEGDGTATATTAEAQNRTEVAAAEKSSFWELVGLIEARYGRRTFALFVFAVTIFFAFVLSAMA